jgi:hypothetical protein
LGRQNKAILQQVVDMQALLFFSRVSFICNICYLITFLFYFIPRLGDGHVVSTILVLGVLVAVVLNLLLTGIIIILFFTSKSLLKAVPKWLIIFNLICCIPQLIFFPA